ncbi:MAG: hypothetical protein IKW02_00330 [Clostridia bacterium]|nr:hypothetical protein [Clostridia bacterium]
MKTVICGGTKSFHSFIKLAVGAENIIKKETVSEALDYALKASASSLFLLPDYDNFKTILEEFDYLHINKITDIIASRKTKIYIENYPFFDASTYYIFGLQALAYPTTLGRNLVKLLGDFKTELGFELLQKRNGVYLQNKLHYEKEIEILAEIRNCLGVHHVLAEDEKSLGIALAKTTNNVYTAMADFSNFDENFTLPHSHWKKFYAKVFGEILDITEVQAENAFSSVYSGISISDGTSIETAVKNAILWHLDSGIMPEKDGSLGVYEMVRSFDLKLAKNIRGDSSLFTAALFSLAGKYFENPDWSKVSQNILDATLINRDLQITQGINKGLFKWFAGTKDFGTHVIYASDSARCGNCLYAIYKATGDENLKNRLIMLGEAFLKWFSGDALIPAGVFNYDQLNLETIQSHERTTAPEFYEAIMILMKNLYIVTADNRYKEQIFKTAEKMAEIYPNFGIGPSHSKNFTLSRALTIFAVAQTFENGSWTKIIDEILCYFNDLQQDCGGFSDGKAYFDQSSLKTDMEFAVGFGPEHGNICDLMYCQNTMTYTLNILKKCRTSGFNKALALKMLEKSVGFLTKTQITSQNKLLSGGWMRAYDMDLGEYYGCDKDFAWGAYSILTGWVTGAIPITFLDMLGMESMY